jgi:hypothetical protein
MHQREETLHGLLKLPKLNIRIKLVEHNLFLPPYLSTSVKHEDLLTNTHTANCTERYGEIMGKNCQKTLHGMGHFKFLRKFSEIFAAQDAPPVL